MPEKVATSIHACEIGGFTTWLCAEAALPATSRAAPKAALNEAPEVAPSVVRVLIDLGSCWPGADPDDVMTAAQDGMKTAPWECPKSMVVRGRAEDGVTCGETVGHHSPMPAPSLADLRRFAIARSLFRP
ncbi:MAG: hypothetical protein KDG44_04200, partial [Burkholderiaceae bacterium]|nr:hypothetical protein [Burkholderiaceae bacterium]